MLALMDANRENARMAVIAIRRRRFKVPSPLLVRARLPPRRPAHELCYGSRNTRPPTTHEWCAPGGSTCDDYPAAVSGDEFSDAERRSFYLETLGDAHDEGPMLHEPYWWANTRFPDRSVEARLELAATTLLSLLDDGLIELFPLNSEQPLDPGTARELILSDTWRTIPVAEIYEFATTTHGAAAADAVPKDVWAGLWKEPRR